MTILSTQYEFVKSSRNVLLNYCAQLSENQLIASVPAFNNSSVRYLLVHIANTYQSWLGNFAMKKDYQFPNTDDIKSLEEIRRLFEDANKTVDEFLNRFEPGENISGTASFRKIPMTATALHLFTHVITHEFHHKGQILSMTRHFGFVPVDTDALRFG